MVENWDQKKKIPIVFVSWASLSSLHETLPYTGSRSEDENRGLWAMGSIFPLTQSMDMYLVLTMFCIGTGMNHES